MGIPQFCLSYTYVRIFLENSAASVISLERHTVSRSSSSGGGNNGEVFGDVDELRTYELLGNR